MNTFQFNIQVKEIQVRPFCIRNIVGPNVMYLSFIRRHGIHALTNSVIRLSRKIESSVIFQEIKFREAV